MTARLPFELLSFDLDGTLVDTAGEIAAAVNLTLAEFALPAQTVAAVTERIGAGTRELMLRLLHDLAAGPGAPAIDADSVQARFAVHYEATAGTTARAYPGVPDALARLRHAGIRLACVTNKEARFAERVLESSGMATMFEMLVAGDTLTVKKPNARVLRHVIDALGATPATTAHVGDSRIDLEAARNAGVAAWAVPYGYNGGEPIASAGPDCLFATIEAVANHVLSGGGSTQDTRDA